MDRKEARACAMKLVYEWELGGDGGEETRIGLLELTPYEHESDYMEQLFAGVVDNCALLDDAISAQLKGWTIERLSRVDLAILRVAAYELILGKQSSAVAINEAVVLAEQYSTDKAPSFINGVLGSIVRASET